MIASISLLAACAGSEERADTKRPLKWSVAESKGPRQVTVRGPVSNCEGLPEPRILEVVKSYRGRRVYIRIVADVPADAPESQEFVCASVGLELEETISLPRPLKELVLFDSGVDPPVQRWPETSSK
ncbi:MAG TPA: hypothetical protein VHR18_10375 [Solirubrobacterales bacterium]|jgi:hypothetical protein|nr:hypothetical protein [Solirubrobacterales bacterium]